MNIKLPGPKYTHGEFLTYKQLMKKKFNAVFSIAGMIIFLAYALLHIYVYDKNIIMITALLCTSLLFLINIIIIFSTKYIELTSNISLICAVLITTMTIIFGANTDFRIIWMILVPLFAFYLKSIVKGAVFIIMALIMLVLVLILNNTGIIKYHVDNMSFIDLISIFAIVTMASYYYEYINSKNETHILNQLYTDSLTKISNRNCLTRDVTNLRGSKLILINADNFKQVNDLYGNAIGDRLLVEIGNRLNQFKKSNYIFNIYKLHADEFALLFIDKIDRSELFGIVSELERNINQVYYINSIEIILSITMGISDTGNNILEEADMALKLAKENQVRYIFFEDSMKIKEKYENNIFWVSSIKKSIISDNIIPVFQPIYNNKTKKVNKFECLMRMSDDSKLISPIHFIEIAKKSRYYTHLTKIILLKSVEYFANKDFSFSLNISLYDIYSKESAIFFSSLIDDYKIGNKLIFELTETEQIENNAQVMFFIDKVKERGCKIAIDDFGTGYSNFDYLLKMHVDILKLDGSIIKNINENNQTKIIVETIVNFAKKLNIETVAEYVYSKDVFDTINNLGIDYSQGYYIGKPDQDINVFFDEQGNFVL